MNILLFKENVHTQITEFTHRLQQGDRVSCEAGDRLHKDQIDFPRTAVFQHFQKAGAVNLGPGNAVIGIYTAVKPPAVVLDQVAVVAYLGRQGMKHSILLRGDTGVCRHAGRFWLFWYVKGDFFDDSIHFPPPISDAYYRHPRVLSSPYRRK